MQLCRGVVLLDKSIAPRELDAVKHLNLLPNQHLRMDRATRRIKSNQRQECIMGWHRELSFHFVATSAGGAVVQPWRITSGVGGA